MSDSTTSYFSATVIGGAGFLGRYIIQHLAKTNMTLTILTRNPHKAIFLRTMGNIGKINLVYGNLTMPSACLAHLQNVDVVINCSGLLYEDKDNTFQNIHVDAPAALAKSAQLNKVQRFIHISALGADADSPSEYARTKAWGEQAVLQAFPNATIIRPSIIVGREDRFFNRFAKMAAISPCLPLVGNPKFQPVYVGDVADAVMACLSREDTRGKIFEIGGPEVFTFRELLEKMLHLRQQQRWIVPVPKIIARGIAVATSWMQEPPLTLDQILLLDRDNVVTLPPDQRLEALGITPKAIDDFIVTD